MIELLIMTLIFTTSEVSQKFIGHPTGSAGVGMLYFFIIGVFIIGVIIFSFLIYRDYKKSKRRAQN